MGFGPAAHPGIRMNTNAAGEGPGPGPCRCVSVALTGALTNVLGSHEN